DASIVFDFGLAPPGGSGAGIDTGIDLGPYRLSSLSVAIDEARALGVSLEAGTSLDGTTLTGRFDVPAFEPSEPLAAVARAYAPDALDVGALDRIAAAGRFA